MTPEGTHGAGPTHRRRRFGRRADADRAARSLENLAPAVEGLMGAIDAGADYLPPDEVRSAEAVLVKASERLALTGGHTVVALAGATGSGKSSLFNALVGDDVATPGRRRPTTTTTTAAVWGDDPATPLLDWLEVAHRHQLAPGRGRGAAGAGLDGLVLLDLPDIDSTAAAHRREADRILDMADVFVWVTDPQKYADALIHDEYLAAARDHQRVTLVVLNQADLMSDDEGRACRDDLKRLLAADGLNDTEVLLTSARTGDGLLDLTEALESAVLTATASRARLLADVRTRARALRGHVADAEPEFVAEPEPQLVAALSRAAGVPAIGKAVEDDERRRALGHTGWPFTRWVRHLRPNPVKRLGLDSTRGDELTSVLARSSLPEATPAARASVELLTRRVGARAAEGLPQRWAQAVEDAVGPARSGGRDVADALDQAVLGVPLTRRTPLWWRAWGLLQWLLAAAVVVGVLWLIGLGVVAWLQLPPPPLPRVWVVPLPTVLAVGGVVLGLLFAALARPLAAIGARRRRRRVEADLAERITDTAREQLLAPVADILERHARTRRHLDAALSA